MRNELPSSAEKMSQTAESSFESKAKEVLEKARMSREWDSPLADAATDAEEMTFVDWAYWLYKAERPVLKAEKNVCEILFMHDKSIVHLPDGFEERTSLTIGAAGDLMPSDGIECSRNIIFEKVADVLFEVDLSFANLEAPVTEQAFKSCAIAGWDPENCTLLRSSVAQFSALAGHNGNYFTALNFANNHALDLGVEGIETTRKLFAQNRITAIGIPKAPEEYARATVIAKAGVKIGFVSATFGLNGRRVPPSENYRVHRAKLVSKFAEPELGLLKKQIEDCERRNCDFIIASMHWGFEFEYFPRHHQIETAHHLVECGVDLILGHHPHVIQPVEYYRPKRDPDRIAVIAYSLGGLTYDGWEPAPHLSLGLALKIKLSKGIMDGNDRTYIECIKPVPVFQKVFHQNHTKVMRLEKLEEQLTETALDRSDEAFLKRVKQIEGYADMVLKNRYLNE
ncbi:CapA family protein [Bradyrhizobium canariense]|uniref:CapA family protein n=1 Tax=Bradyrhizobium canariense TaxID=255045 RepID=UPI001FE7C899|nr:CapA family protein [Bradyrhizobium canariense]MBW5439303.1 CapA family protein [Bradyrhizobium canariense]